MLEIDYIINRQLSDDVKIELKPDQIPSKLPNVVYIEGPNDSGKSTILNIIALSLYGLKNKSIKDSLKSKMNSLLTSEHQEIEFKILLSNKNQSIKLRSIKKNFDDNEIFVEESINNGDFVPLGYDLFEKKYRLIYDIPEKPTERLYDLLNELEYEQNRYGEKIKRFNSYIYNIIRDIGESRDPVRLKRLKELVKKLRNETLTIKKEIPIQNKLYDELSAYYNVICYCKYYNELEMISKRIEELDEKEYTLTKKKDTYSRKYNSLRKKMGRNLDTIFSRKNKIKPMLTNSLSKKNVKRMDIWNNIGIYNTTDFKFDKNLEFFTNEFLIDVLKQRRNIEKDNLFKNAYIFKEIIDYLKSFKNYSLFISTINMNLNEFINLLSKENKQYENILNKHEGLKDLETTLKLLKDDISSATLTLNEMKKYNQKDVEITEEFTEFDDERSNISEFKSKYDEVKKHTEYFYLKCLECNIDQNLLKNNIPKLLQIHSKNEQLTPFYTLDEIKLQQKIFELKNTIDGKTDRTTANDILVEQYEKDIKQIDNMEPHKYEDKLKELNEILSITDKLSSKLLKSYDEYIKQLKKKKIKSITTESTLYYDKVSIFLANKIGTFWNIDTEYKADKIDLIKNVIHTNNGSTIHITDLGTGRGQSAYLKGLLNVPNDNRKIIALFDEIAAMDQKALFPIFQKINELYHDNRLILGILVQKADEKVKIISLENI